MKSTICLLRLLLHTFVTVTSGQQVSTSLPQSVHNIVERLTAISPPISTFLHDERFLLSPAILQDRSCTACYGGKNFTVADPNSIIVPDFNTSCTDLATYLPIIIVGDSSLSSNSPQCIFIQLYATIFCGCPEAPPYSKQNCRLCSSGKDVNKNYRNTTIDIDLYPDDPSLDVYLTCDQMDHYINFAFSKSDTSCYDVQTYLGDSFCGCSDTTVAKSTKKKGKKGVKGKKRA